jgi:hypothetical protein
MNRLLIALVLTLGIVFTSVLGNSQIKIALVEYKFEKECTEKKANQLAVEGWELTEMSTASYGSIGVVTCVFKRPK